jgi:hypothetical protein
VNEEDRREHGYPFGSNKDEMPLVLPGPTAGNQAVPV